MEAAARRAGRMPKRRRRRQQPGDMPRPHSVGQDGRSVRPGVRAAGRPRLAAGQDARGGMIGFWDFKGSSAPRLLSLVVSHAAVTQSHPLSDVPSSGQFRDSVGSRRMRHAMRHRRAIRPAMDDSAPGFGHRPSHHLVESETVQQNERLLRRFFPNHAARSASHVIRSRPGLRLGIFAGPLTVLSYSGHSGAGSESVDSGFSGCGSEG
jgi:hypothetical protein